MPRGSWLTRLRLTRVEWALALALPATVFAFAMGSSSIAFTTHIGLTLRWVMLFVLAGVAIAFGWPDRNRVSRPLVALVGSLGAVGLLSSTWSVDPRITAERAISFLVVTATACLIGAGAVGSRRRMDVALNGLLIGAGLIAFAGLLVYVFDHSLAVQPAEVNMPARLRGFGQNPNTAALLFGLVLPISVLRLTTARSRQGRVAAVAVTALLYGSVLASGSRGAMLAAAAGTLVFVVIRLDRLRILVPTTAVLVAFFLACFSVAGTRPSGSPLTVEKTAAAVVSTTTTTAKNITKTATTTATKTVTKTATETTTTPVATAQAPTTGDKTSSFTATLAPTVPKARVLVPFVSEVDEIGYPGLYEYKSIYTMGSGRVFAWISAIHQGLARPFLGFGFGTEQYVFADRFTVFDGAYAENAFVGMFLQLGILGVLLLLGPFLLVGVVVLRNWRRRAADNRMALATGAGAVAAGLVLAFFQSYIYSVGDIATLSFWTLLFVTTTAARGYDPRRRPTRSAAEEDW